MSLDLRVGKLTPIVDFELPDAVASGINKLFGRCLCFPVFRHVPFQQLQDESSPVNWLQIRNVGEPLRYTLLSVGTV